MATFKVQSPNVCYTEDFIESRYVYDTTKVLRDSKNSFTAIPIETEYTFRTERKVPRLGCMLVGWGGNNGTTITAAVLANKLKLTWNTKEGSKVGLYFPLGIKNNRKKGNWACLKHETEKWRNGNMFQFFQKGKICRKCPNFANFKIRSKPARKHSLGCLETSDPRSPQVSRNLGPYGTAFGSPTFRVPVHHHIQISR